MCLLTLLKPQMVKPQTSMTMLKVISNLVVAVAEVATVEAVEEAEMVEALAIVQHVNYVENMDMMLITAGIGLKKILCLPSLYSKIRISSQLLNQISTMQINLLKSGHLPQTILSLVPTWQLKHNHNTLL